MVTCFCITSDPLYHKNQETVSHFSSKIVSQLPGKEKKSLPGDCITICKILEDVIQFRKGWTEKKKVKYATKKILESIQQSDKKKHIIRNREVRTELLKKNIKYPVMFSFIHNDKEMRVQFVANENEDTFIQDMPFESFNNLPEIEVSD